MSGALVPPQPLDVVAWITVRYHANGSMTIGGTIADKPVALAMLDHAKDAITRQIREPGIIIPNRDVDVEPSAAHTVMGDIPEAERGDP